jgi:hypothetical protein
MLDPSGKDVSRLRYVSFDPELWYNPNARIWKKEIKKTAYITQLACLLRH